jgi:hypothetical protein
MESVSTRPERRAPRVPATIPVRLLLHGEDSTPGLSARTIDLSERGMRIRADFELSQGQIVRIASWGESGQPMPCRVVWAQRTPGGESHAGMEYLGVAQA